MFVQKLLRNMRVGGASILVFPKRFFACRTKKEMFTSKILKVKSRWKSEVEVENKPKSKSKSKSTENRSRSRNRDRSWKPKSKSKSKSTKKRSRSRNRSRQKKTKSNSKSKLKSEVEVENWVPLYFFRSRVRKYDDSFCAKILPTRMIWSNFCTNTNIYPETSWQEECLRKPQGTECEEKRETKNRYGTLHFALEE